MATAKVNYKDLENYLMGSGAATPTPPRGFGALSQAPLTDDVGIINAVKASDMQAFKSGLASPQFGAPSASKEAILADAGLKIAALRGISTTQGVYPAAGVGFRTSANVSSTTPQMLPSHSPATRPVLEEATSTPTPAAVQPQGSGGMYLTSNPTKIYSAVGPATGGFGIREDLRQREVDLVAGREAAGAVREAEGAAKVAAEQAAAQKAADVVRIAQLQDIIRANAGNEFDGPAKIAAAQAELATLTGQQTLRQKESEAAGKNAAEMEKARLGFKGLEAQAQASKEAKVEAATIAGLAKVEAEKEKALGIKGKGTADKETEEQKKLAEAEVTQAIQDAAATGTDVRTALGMRRAGMRPKLFGDWNPLQKNRTGWANAEGVEVTQVPKPAEAQAVSKSGRPIIYKNGVAYYAS